MKKLFILLTIIALIFAFVACSDNDNAINTQNTEVNSEENTTEENVAVENNTNDAVEEDADEDVTEAVERKELSIITLKGPTGMGMVQLMENDELETSALDYSFELVGAPDQIIGKVVQGAVDVAAVPTNLASILNVKTEGNIEFLAVNTLGVLFILENGDTVNGLADLEGKTIVTSGKGASPEYILNYLLAENNLTESVTVEYKAEHAEVAAAFATGEADIVLLPQPFVTSALLSNENASIAVDMTSEWETLTNSVLPMGGIIVNKAFAQENPDVIATFMEEYKASVEFVNANPADAGQLIEKFTILPKAALATKAIPNCNITLLTAQESKEDVQKFLEILHGFNPKAVGGTLPEDSFYYED